MERRLEGGCLADAWLRHGLCLVEARPATAAELAATPTTWAKRLGLRGSGAPDRTAWRLVLQARAGRRRPDTRRYPPAMLGGPGPYGVSAPRILIVDDDPNLLVILADQLRADGYEVQTARDGEEALRRLGQAWPDLLIIDMLMPRMDGLTLAREVKARADLPIIVLSAIDTADFEGRPPRGGRRGLRHQAVPLPGAAARA